MSQTHTPSLQMPSLAKWSVDDYHQMIDIGLLRDRQVELLNGDIVEMSPVGSLHEGRGDNVADYLRERLGYRARIRGNKAVTLSPTSEPEPDIAVVEYRDYSDHHPYPENIYLLIEIAKTSLTYDLEVKRPAYARAGIQEYWVLDIVNQKLYVFHSLSGKGVTADYQVEEVLNLAAEAPIIRIQAFPDIELSVGKMQQLGGQP